MRAYAGLITLVSIVWLLGACVDREVANYSGVVETNSTPPIVDTDEIDAAIKNLYTNDYSQIYHNRDVLVGLAEKSPETRSLIITKLLTEKSKFHESRTKPEDYNYWAGLVLTLGGLKATEAIDVLAAEMGRTDIFTGGGLLEHHPAAKALADIGEPSLPAIRKVFLDTSADQSDRVVATCLIAIIGNSQDRIFLKEHLKTEKDARVRGWLEDIVRGEIYPPKNTRVGVR